MDGINTNLKRCDWIQGKPAYYIEYHDNIWGKLEYDDQILFKWLSLEIFHIGLSWQLVLSKYEKFMEAFDNFDYMLVAEYNESKIKKLMANNGIIRYRKKIEAVIHNAQQIQSIQKKYGSFSAYLWDFTTNQQIVKKEDKEQVKSDLSDQVTQGLKTYDFKFIGSITIYSYLQAIGIINGHDLECEFR